MESLKNITDSSTVNHKKIKLFNYFYNFLNKEINNIDNTNTLFKEKFFREILKQQLSISMDNYNDINNKSPSEESNINYDINYVHNYINNEQGDYIFKSYPTNNLLYIFTNNLYLSMEMKSFIFKFEKLSGFQDHTQDSIEKINSELFEKNKNSIIEVLENLENEEKSEINIHIEIILNCLGYRGILTYLGIRTTPSSADLYLPPKLDFLYEKFKELHTKEGSNPNKKSSILTVGARALCKHTHRSNNGFWPQGTGKEIEKNIRAESILNKLISECTWINIHQLPHDIIIIELRNTEGYGIRWQVNDGAFRGFLEPQMEDGHEKGWKH